MSSFYSSTGPGTNEKIASAFKARYGISVDALRLASGPLAQRYASEATAGNVVADVVQIADLTFFEQAVAKGWIAKLSESLPSLAQWPKEDWNGSFAKVHVSPLTLEWNSSVVRQADAPKGWQDVLKPAFKGRILMVDPRAAPVLMSWALLLSKTCGEKILRDIAAQQPRLVPSSVPGSQQLAAGAGSVLLPATHSDALTMQAQNAPISDVFPSPTVGNESYVGVSAKAPHPNAARLLVNFVLSPEGQEIYVKDGYSSVRPNMRGAESLPSGYTTPDLRAGQAAAPELLDLLGIH